MKTYVTFNASEVKVVLHDINFMLSDNYYMLDTEEYEFLHEMEEILKTKKRKSHPTARVIFLFDILVRLKDVEPN
jgi:hypothetical protein